MNVFNRFRGSGGGSMGKMMQQLELPMSLIYEGSDSEKAWGTMEAAGQPDMAGSCYDNGIIYHTKAEKINSVDKTVLYKQNYATKSMSTVVFPFNPYLRSTYCYLFIYDGELYAFYANQPADQSKIYGYVYKFNQASATLTVVKTWQVSDSGTGDYVSDVRFARINETTIAAIVFRRRRDVVELYGFYTAYDFLANSTYVSSTVLFSNAGVGSSRFVQTTDTKCYIGVSVYKNGANPPVLNVFEVDKSNPFSLPIQKTVENFADFYTGTESVQVGSKLMYIASGLVGGKHTGELDLTTGVIDPTKYPDCPADVNPSLYNAHLINDEIVVQSTGKTYALKLIPRLPQEMPLYMKLFKGDRYSAPFAHKDIAVLPLATPSQPAFTITNKQQTAAQDLEIHDCQYELQGSPTQILVEKK